MSMSTNFLKRGLRLVGRRLSTAAPAETAPAAAEVKEAPEAAADVIDQVKIDELLKAVNESICASNGANAASNGAIRAVNAAIQDNNNNFSVFMSVIGFVIVGGIFLNWGSSIALEDRIHKVDMKFYDVERTLRDEHYKEHRQMREDLSTSHATLQQILRKLP